MIDIVTGALCGSQFVTENFLKWAKTTAAREHGGFKNLLQKLGMGSDEFRYKASRAFEEPKRQFSDPRAPPQDVVVRGTQGEIPKVIFEVTGFVIIRIHLSEKRAN